MGLVVLLAHPANAALVVVLTVPAMLWTAIVRSRPRRITSVSVIEVGLGVVASPEIVSFYLAGMVPSLISFYMLCSHAL